MKLIQKIKNQLIGVETLKLNFLFIILKSLWRKKFQLDKKDIQINFFSLVLIIFNFKITEIIEDILFAHIFF